MDGRRIYYVAAFTFLAGFIGQMIPPPQNYKMDAWSRRDRIRYTSIYTIVGASVGAALGSVIATRKFGPAPKRRWQFGITAMFLVTAVCAVLSLAWKGLYKIFVF